MARGNEKRRMLLYIYIDKALTLASELVRSRTQTPSRPPGVRWYFQCPHFGIGLASPGGHVLAKCQRMRGYRRVAGKAAIGEEISDIVRFAVCGNLRK